MSLPGELQPVVEQNEPLLKGFEPKSYQPTANTNFDFGKTFDNFISAPSSENAKYQPVTFNWEESGADRYVKSPYLKELGFNPGDDNEEKFGQRQTWGNTLSNAFVGGGKLAWDGFIDGWKGWGRMGDALISLDWDKLRGDEASMLELNKDMEDVMNSNAIFNTKESENTFFNRKTLGNMVQQSGFTVGTIGQMVVEQAVTKAIEAALFVPTAGTASVAIEAATAVNTSAKLGRLASILYKSKKLFDAKSAFTKLKKIGDIWKDEAMMTKVIKGVGSKIPGIDIAMDLNKAIDAGATAKQLAYIGAGGIKRMASEANLAFTEARMEAAGTYSELVNKMTADHIATFGEEPNGADLEKINSTALKASDASFNFNASLLGVMNRIQFDNVLKGYKSSSKMGKLFGLGESQADNLLTVKGISKTTGKEINQTYRKGAMGQLGVTGQIAKEFGTKKAATELGFAVLKSGAKWEVSEGVQELLQEGSGTYFKDLYMNQYAGIDSSSQSWDKAIDSQLNMQGLKTFMSGALTGLITSAPMHFIQQAQQNATKKGREGVKDYNKRIDTHLNELNGVMKDITGVYSEAAKNFNIQDAISKELNNAVKDKSKFAFENLKTSALGQLMATAVRNGTHEGLIDTLKGYGEHFSKEEFEKAFVGASYSSDNKKKADDYTNNLVGSLENYAKDWEFLQDKFGGVHNPDAFIPGSQEQLDAKFAKRATDDMIEILASNRFKAKESLKRMTSIYAKVSSTPGTGGSLAHSFTVLGSEQHTDSEIFNLKQSLKALKANKVIDAATNKMIKQKEDQLEALEYWKENKTELLNPSVLAKSNSMFKKFVDSKNEESGLDIKTTTDEMDEQFDAMIDYVKLNKQSQSHTDAYNMLIDGKNFSKLYSKLLAGSRNAAFAMQQNAINTAMGLYGFSIENEALLKRADELSKKTDFTPEDDKEYFDIIKELEKAALSYTKEKADKYYAMLDEIISKNVEFGKENEVLINRINELTKEISGEKFSMKPKPQLIAERNGIYDQLMILADNFLRKNPSLMTQAAPAAPVPVTNLLNSAPPAPAAPPVKPVDNTKGIADTLAQINLASNIDELNAVRTSLIGKPWQKDVAVQEALNKKQITFAPVLTELEQKVEALDLSMTPDLMHKAISELLKAHPNDLSLNALLLKKIENYTFNGFIDGLKQLINRNVASSSYVPLSAVIPNITYTLTQGNNVFELTEKDGKYFDLYTSVEVIVPEGSSLRKNTLDRVDSRVGVNIKSNTLESGIKVTEEDVLKNALTSNPNMPFKVTGSKMYSQHAAKKLALIQQTLPKRTAITHENSGQRNLLQRGQSIIATSTMTDGFSIKITLPGMPGEISINFQDNYYIVHPNNFTEVIDFSPSQTAFLLTNLTVDDFPVTVGQLEIMRKAYQTAQAFKAEAEVLFEKNMDADLTDLFAKYWVISTSGLVLDKETKGSLGDVVADPANQKNLVQATIAEFDEAGEIVPGTEKPFAFPLIQNLVQKLWVVADPTVGLTPSNPDNKIRLVHNGEIISAESFVKDVMGKVLPKDFGPTAHRFITMTGTPTTSKIYLEQKRGTEPITGFMNLVQGLLQEVDKITPDTNVNDQMKKFNQRSFTFKPQSGINWKADFNVYIPKGGTPQILIEIANKDYDKNLSKEAKKVFNIFLPDGAVKRIKALIDEHGIDAILASEELTGKVNEQYNIITEFLANKMLSLRENLQSKVNPDEFQLLEASGLPDFHLLVEYKMVDSKKTWILKAMDKNLNLSDPSNFSVIWNDSNVAGNRKLQIATIDRTVTPVVASNSIVPTEILPPTGSSTPEQLAAVGSSTDTKPTAPIEIIDSFDPDEEAPFSLLDEEFIPYTDESYNTEAEWMDNNLPADLRRGALEDIINSLEAGKAVLGYYSNRVMYFSKTLSSRGTGYHEAFHGVFRELMNQERRDFYISKALKEVGFISKDTIENFRKDRRMSDKTDDQIKRLIAEEYLADGFKAYMLNKTEPTQSWFKMFVRLLEKVLNFFTGAKPSIDDLYKEIAQGGFKNKKAQGDNNQEGAFDLAYGRPTKVIRNVNGVDKIDTSINIINNAIQDEMINRLAHLIPNTFKEGRFDEKFEKARLMLIEEYQISEMLKGVLPENIQAAKNKYEEKFLEYQFALGAPTPFILSDEVKALGQEIPLTTQLHSGITVKLIKSAVKAKIESLGIEDGWYENMDKELLNDEEIEENVKSGDFDKIHINPMIGMSRQFRSLFSLVPYVEKDEVTGVSYNKMIDGARTFDAIMKVAANNKAENVFLAFAASVDLMKEEEDPNYPKMYEMLKFFGDQFGMDIKNKDYTPTRGFHFYNQFVDTFFVTEDPSYQLLLSTFKDKSIVDIKDASIQSDVGVALEKIKFEYETKFTKLPLDIQAERLEKVREVLSKHFDLLRSGPIKVAVTNAKELKAAVKEIKAAFDLLHINVPKYLITNSLAGIYFVEEGNSTTGNVVKTNIYKYYAAQEQLFRDKAFLQKDFFHQFLIGKVKAGDNIFQKTPKTNAKSSDKVVTINMINGILKKAAKMIVKYDINTSVSVFKNGAGENVYRYTRFTPPGLLAQIVRHDGIEGLIAYEPELADWYADSPLMEATEENKLFLQNFELSLFGGFKQTLDSKDREGITFGSIDKKTLYLSGLLFFMDRQVINGKKTSITTFKRSRTQEEATTTNYLVSGLYEKMVDTNGNMTQSVVDKLLKSTKQEFNRIAREWADKDNIEKTRYLNYNDTIDVDGNTKSDDEILAKQRAMQFRVLEHFFKNQTGLSESLINAAISGKSFEEAVQEVTGESTMKDVLENEFRKYMESEIASYKDELLKYKIIMKSAENRLYSELLPSTIKEDYAGKKLTDMNYSIDSLVTDAFLNIFINKLTYNQIFDGDLAITTKNATEYYKRNKSGVISGNSMKTGYHRTAMVEELVVYVDKNNLDQGQYDSLEDIPAELRYDEKGNERYTPEKVFDGQSVHTMNHRMVMYQKWGRNDPKVMEILKKARYMELTNQEIKAMADLKIVLNTIKSATGGIITYNKLSEHLLLRTDVSGLIIPSDVTDVEAYTKTVHSKLKALHEQIDVFEAQLLEFATGHPLEESLEGYMTALYEQIQSYWAPLPGRKDLHYMLNSMELSGVDQLFDPNASKKGKLIPTKLNKGDVTDLRRSKRKENNLFKFMQVETSGVHDTITMPTQARQLITAYLSASDNADLQEMAKNYSSVLGQIARSATEKVNRILLDSNDNLNISSLYKAMRRDLESQNADSNTLKMLDLDKDGKPLHNPNFPVIKKLFINYYFSFYSKNIFSEKVSGRHDVLVSSHGYKILEDAEGKIITTEEQKKNVLKYSDSKLYKTRHLGVQKSIKKDSSGNDITIYTVEVMIPKPMFENDEHRKLWEEKLNTFFGTRIPTEDKRSMIVAKVVDYLDSSYTNSIVVPQFIHMLAGSDLDVDSLYSQTYANYTDFNDRPHKYGDYSTHMEYYGSTASQAKFAEYITYMTKDPAVKDLIAEEKEKVEVNPTIPAELANITEELNLPWLDNPKEDMLAQINDLKAQRDNLDASKKELSALHKTTFEEWLAVKKENDRKRENGEKVDYRIQGSLSTDFNNARDQKNDLEAEKNERTKGIQLIEEHIKRVDRLITLIATINILKQKNLPVTQANLTLSTKKGINHVIPVLQNEVLDIKIDILSHQEVFNNMYIKETSEHDAVTDVAKSIGANVNDIVDANSIYSPQGDNVANDINSSNKDGISITAAFVKFLAFAVKEKIDLKRTIFYTSKNGVVKSHNSFQNERKESIRQIGVILGVFADGAKNPVPSVLNLNTVTASVSEVMMGLGISTQSSLLINKVPIIEQITNETLMANSAISTSGDKYSRKSFSSIASQYTDKFRAALGKRMNELYELDDEGFMIYDSVTKGPVLRTIIMNETKAGPNPNFVNMISPTVDNLGFELTYENGDAVALDVAEYYLLEKWLAIDQLNRDIQKVGSVLNLVKKLDPSFETVDKIFSNYSYLLKKKNSQFANISDVLNNSEEYKPLMTALKQLEKYSQDIFIERNKVMYSVDKVVKSGLNSYEITNAGVRENLTNDMIKYIIINKYKEETQKELNDLLTNNGNPNKIQNLQNAMKFYDADYWINNDFKEDLIYMLNTHAGNSFVEFLKISEVNNFEVIEGMSRMKLDKDLAESVINGYQALQKGSDIKAAMIANKLFFHCLIKDGLGFSNNSFIKYVDPGLVEFVKISKFLNELQSFLKASTSEIDKILKSGFDANKKQALINVEIENIFKNFFQSDNKSLDGFVKNIINYTGTYVKNSRVRVMSKPFDDTGKIDGKAINSKQTAEINTILSMIFKDTYDQIVHTRKMTGKVNDEGTYLEETKIKLDFFAPNDMRPEIGKVTVDLTDIIKDEQKMDMALILLSNVGIHEVEEVGIQFPLFVTNKFNQILQLVQLDGKDIQNQIKNNTIKFIVTPDAPMFEMIGLKAEYRVTENTGTSNIMNSAFTEEDGRKLYQHSLIKPTDTEGGTAGIGYEQDDLGDDYYAQMEAQNALYETESSQAVPVMLNVTKNVGSILSVEEMGDLAPSKAAQPTQASTDVKTNTVQSAPINVYSTDNKTKILSNFGYKPFTININGKPEKFSTVEHYFQAMKAHMFKDSSRFEAIQEAPTPLDAKSLGRKVDGFNKSTWEKFSMGIMKQGMKAAFEQNKTAMHELLITGTAELTHVSPTGANLGKWSRDFPIVLMELRAEFQKGIAPTILPNSGNSAPKLPTVTTPGAKSIKNNVIPLKGNFSRQSVMEDPDYLYLFTDNSYRRSGGNSVDRNSWYSKKYGAAATYPSVTQAVIRGVENAFPITTMVDDKRTQWTDNRFDEYKKIIDDEIATIQAAFANYKGIKFSAAMPFGQGQISNMSASAPKIFAYMNTKLAEIGIINQAQTPPIDPDLDMSDCTGKKA